MRYVSTRGQAPILGFDDAMLAGLARDGGLYVPETVPQIPVHVRPPWPALHRTVTPTATPTCRSARRRVNIL